MGDVPTPKVTSDSASRMTPEDAAEAGMRVGMIYKKVGVSADSDPATTPVFYALIAGLNAAGADVESAGICPAAAACLSSAMCSPRQT